ncbi:CFI-box-CTERM domain-containing protein [Gottfriedia endophytica]|uniref:CFI-box-CTERM domain-containing protein n=1 Tax=Gottfriedia endophytica TaxID=2820819 RepID=UPI00389969D2
MYNRVYYRTTKKACYIATTVYGDVDAWQVVKLREYRDSVLRKKFLGRLFIYMYYLISPKLIWLFKHIKPVNTFTKKVLDHFINQL